MSKEIPELDRDFVENGQKTYLRHLSVDCVIFGFHENELKVLLIRWKDGPWCLPGGFVKKEESLDKSASRILHERTGLDDIFLQQFHVFGDANREKDKEEFNSKLKDSWIMDRFVTVGYYALVEYSKVKPKPDWLSDECSWWDIHSIPSLVYDHNEILEKALDVLRQSLNDHPIGYNLLPEKFTMPELQRLYETILDKEIDRRNFQKKLLSLDILVRLEERKTGGAHKAPYLYRFDKRKYDRALKEGLTGGF
ncbi:MAG: NUDIX domain-containing protein [Chryseolinea sp.]